jgi:hypothetical protein
MMIISIFTQTDHAEGALTNLLEADFQAKDISIVMKTDEEAQAISNTYGPLTGTPIDELDNRLTTLGLSQKDALQYQDMVRKGKVLIAISTANRDEEEAVKEILKGQNGKLIKKL